MAEKAGDVNFHQILETFPALVREDLYSIKVNGGMLPVERCRTVIGALNLGVEELMQRLLPVAGLYSATPVSDFRVGAVAKARMSNNQNNFALFLGANVEFPTQSIVQTIHAEQSAVINAWLGEANQIDSIAVTSTPCGCCRQFLYELKGGRDLKIYLGGEPNRKTARHKLSELLPEAFGPEDLGVKAGLMSVPSDAPDIDLKTPSDDPPVLEALAAAEKSYAPYSQNKAGCVIETANGTRYAGRYAENAAFNPSLSPLHTAIILMNMDLPGVEEKISRAVLVERPTATSQRAVCELLLRTIAPDVQLEYFEAI